MLIENIQMMNQAAQANTGMDILIISVKSKQEEHYWTTRLEETRQAIIKPNAKILIVQEHWKGATGNGLGTLNAYLEASKKYKSLYGIDLLEAQKQGASIALYHTVGQGSRLYPLVASNLGNKSATKLPGFITTKKGDKKLMTLLEAIIKQTSVYAPFRKGRLSVFWGDQLFIPAKTIHYIPKHHVDLFVKQIPYPSETEWKNKSYENYGIVLLEPSQNLKLAEKIDYKTLTQITRSKDSPFQGSFAISLGAFSISRDFLQALLQLFQKELQEKSTRFDTDLHFWMPMTLTLEEYSSLMEKMGWDKTTIKNHYDRVHSFAKTFFKTHPEFDAFTTINTGRHSYWWDFGSVQSYYETLQKMTKANQESDALRMFFNIYQDDNFSQTNLIEKDPSSLLVNCKIESGKIRNSLLVGVTADFIDVQDCVILNSSFTTFQGKKNLVYHARQETPLQLSNEVVRADVLLEDSEEQFVFYTELTRNGKKDFNEILSQNPCSYQEIQTRTQTMDLQTVEELFENTIPAL